MDLLGRTASTMNFEERTTASTPRLTVGTIAPALVLLGGLVQLISKPFWVTPDGVAYLEISEAWLRHDLAYAVRGAWSPLYAWALMPAVAIGGEDRVATIIAGKITNAVILLLAIAAFAWLLRLIGRARQAALCGGFASSSTWSIYAWGLFAWTTLGLIGVYDTSPDLLGLLCVCVMAAGLMLTWIQPTLTSGWLTAGVAAAFAYLARAPLFLVAPLFLAAAAVPAVRRRDWRGPLVAFGTYACITLPWLLVLSAHMHHITFSDAGKIAYVSDVLGAPRVYWQGTADSPLQHATRIIFQSPRIYAFAEPFHVAFPPHFGIDWFYANAPIHFSLAKQVQASRNAIAAIADCAQLAIIAWLVLLLLPVRHWERRPLFMLILPSAVALGLFVLTHVEPRYLAPWLLLIGLGIPATAVWSDLAQAGARATALALSLMLAIALSAHIAFDAIRPEFARTRAAWGDLVMAEVLHGIPEVSRTIAVAGNGHQSALWAYIAHARIVAEIDRGDLDHYWHLSDTERACADAALIDGGVNYVVGRDAPPDAEQRGWRKVGNGAFVLRRPSRSGCVATP